MASKDGAVQSIHTYNPTSIEVPNESFQSRVYCFETRTWVVSSHPADHFPSVKETLCSCVCTRAFKERNKK